MKLHSKTIFGLFVLMALMLPLAASGNKFFAFVLGMTFISLLWATGMNLMYGYVGLMPLMFAGVAGVAGYAMVHFTRTLGWSFWLAMPVALTKCPTST